MNESKFTPGPLQACGATIYAGDVAIAGCYAEAFRELLALPDDYKLPDSESEINEYGHSLHGCGVEEAWANARLYAAAPKLYAWIEKVTSGHGEVGTVDEGIALLREARGEK